MSSERTSNARESSGSEHTIIALNPTTTLRGLPLELPWDLGLQAARDLLLASSHLIATTIRATTIKATTTKATKVRPLRWFAEPEASKTVAKAKVTTSHLIVKCAVVAMGMIPVISAAVAVTRMILPIVVVGSVTVAAVATEVTMVMIVVGVDDATF